MQGPYERLTSGDTSNLLLINLILVVVLIVLSNAAMYFGAERHPDRAGRVPIRFFGLVAAVAGLYAVSPLAEFPFLYMRYIALLVMVLATFGAFVTYLRGRLRFRYGSPGRNYRIVLMATGVVAAVIALNMGFMKSNSRVPYTVYNQPGYTVQPRSRRPGSAGEARAALEGTKRGGATERSHNPQRLPRLRRDGSDSRGHTHPPAAFVLSPIIKTDVLGESDVGSGWVEVGPVSEVSAEEPSHFRVEFPLQQLYGREAIQKASWLREVDMSYKLDNAIWLSWKAPIKQQGRQGSNGDVIGKPERPAILDEKSEGFTESERKEILSQLNVLSNSCAHLGCPVRWFSEKQLYLCPCHGGLYDINGGWVGGPPPRGMYRYIDAEVRENGKLYVRHKFDIEPGLDKQQPYVV